MPTARISITIGPEDEDALVELNAVAQDAAVRAAGDINGFEPWRVEVIDSDGNSQVWQSERG